jgi:mono/diheme cytochrome c family protein
MRGMYRAGILFSIVLIVSNGCTSASKDQLLPQVCKVDNLTYTQDIQKIFEVNCYACHGSNSNETSGGIDLQDTAVLDIYIKSNQLQANIMHSAGSNPMPPPPEPKLTDCEINQINAWIIAGAPKN